MVKTAVIGAGRWGAEIIRVLNDCSELTWCCNLHDKGKLALLKEKYPHVKLTQRIEDILNDKSIQAVAIATPIGTHYKLAKQCLLKGKDVFVEKPLSDTVIQSVELEKLAKKKKRILSVGFILLYSPAYEKMKNLINKESKVQIVSNWLKWGTFKEDIMLNLAGHDIAFLVDLFGNPINAKKQSSEGLVSKADSVFVRMNWKKHRAVLYYNRVSVMKCKIMTVKCSTGIFATDGTSVRKMNNAGEWEVIFEDKREPLAMELKEFITAVKKGTETRTPAALGVQVQKVLEKLV